MKGIFSQYKDYLLDELHKLDEENKKPLIAENQEDEADTLSNTNIVIPDSIMNIMTVICLFYCVLCFLIVIALIKYIFNF